MLSLKEYMVGSNMTPEKKDIGPAKKMRVSCLFMQKKRDLHNLNS